MNKINRNTFLKESLKIGALAVLNPLDNYLFVNTSRGNTAKGFLLDEDVLKRLVTANDNEVARLLSYNSGKKIFGRRTAHEFAILSASYCSPKSKYYQSIEVTSALDELVKHLLSVQSEDGTVNLGNLESPPDTAFLLEQITAGAYVLAKVKSKDVTNINNEIKKFILRAGDALTVGGVHTPNHRWVLCAALARVHALYPSQKYIDRIEEWMGESIFIDSDGNFPERSKNYAAVEDNSLITLGRLLNKPTLFEPVRKNLEMNYYCMEPNGDLVTTESRRQDQYSSKSIVSFYLYYRYLAILDNNATFSAIAKLIENVKGFDEEILTRSLIDFLENPLLQKELPLPGTLPVDYVKIFSTSDLLRIRRGDRTTTFFGGADWPLIIASGRSNSPNFYSYRNGNAILKYMRLSSGFFSMGYFYSDGLKKAGDKYVLFKKLEVPYYQPLPKNERNVRGDYKLSPSIDDRFWNKMDFEKRPVSNVKTLETTVTLLETNGGNELNFEVTGLKGVPITIELCFKEGGKLSGVLQGNDNNSFLEKGMGRYEFGGDAIQFGPGIVTHKSVNGLEGERYSTHFGSLRTDGLHVYLTGTTPFSHKLTFN